ncbi:MAG: chromosomal replication initiator protein [Myxococcota bacterium]|jgi:chromosomal replication initiator protein
MEQIWNQVKGSLKETLGPQNYAIWIRSIQFVSHTADQISLQVPNRYYRDWVQSNYGTTLQNALREELGFPITIRFQIGNEPPEPQEEAPTPQSPQQILLAEPDEPVITKRAPVASGVSDDKIFSNFVVGACNQFAHAASLAVAESPGDRQYNPLFIYGSTGLGKTHLLHAIGNHIKSVEPNSHILYVTAERFTNDLIDALRYRRMSEFRERYRKRPTMLLMDDVQFLTGKDRTQEELFHTFEWLKERGRQIVFTSDVLPREIKMFEPRLRTRCESGMLADTQPPDMETMLAILQQKAEGMEMELSSELAQYIASRVRGNIRELEGVLNRLKALCRLHKSQPTIDFARMYLGNVLADEPHLLSADEIIQTVANFFNVKVVDIKGKRRLKQFVRPRHVAMWMIRKHTDLSFPDIGRVFNDRDHATVQHACKRIRGLLERDADTQNTIRLLERNLGR